MAMNFLFSLKIKVEIKNRFTKLREAYKFLNNRRIEEEQRNPIAAPGPAPIGQ
jgi:hypothetical protein